jgi:hypothetical protein
MATTTINPRRKKATKVLARKAFTDEQNRRAKPRNQRGRASSWVFSGLGNADLAAILDGKIVSVTFGSGRVEHVAAAA